MTPFRSLSVPEQHGEAARIVAEYGVDTTLLQGAIDNIADVLEVDEVLIAMVAGRLERPLVKGLVDLGLGDLTPRLIALTDRRLIGIRKRALRSVDETSILLSAVEDVQSKAGVFQGSISIRADGRNYLIGGMQKRSIDRFVSQVELAIQAKHQQAVTDAANASETEERMTLHDDAQLPNESPSDSESRDDESQAQTASPAPAPQSEGIAVSDTDSTAESAQTSPAHDPASRADSIADDAADFRVGLDMADAETVTQHAKAYVISEGIVRPRIPSLLHALRPGEEVVFFTTGVDANKTVLIALTDRRIVLSDKDLQRTNSVDLVGLSAISGQTGLVQGGIFVDFDGHHRKFGSVPNKTVEPFVSLARDAAATLEMQTHSQHGESTEDPTQTTGTPRTVAPFAPVAIKGLGVQDRADVYRRLAFEIGDDGFMTRGELDHLPTVMMPDELLLWFASGALQSTGKEQRAGGFTLVALTDRRILLLDKKFLAGIQTIAIDLDRINSITGDTGLLFGNVKIQDGGDERKIGLIKNDTVQPFVDRVQEAIQQRKQRLHDQQAAAIASASAPTTVAAPAVNIADELEKLASLMERGILTPEEFAHQKAKLLQG